MINWEEYYSVFKRSLSSTLENITFSFVDEIPDGFTPKKVATVSSVISIELHSTGSFYGVLTLPEPYLDGIIESLFPNGSSDNVKSDTINELNNTLFGSFFRENEKDVGEFVLGIPNTVNSKSGATEYECAFLVDDDHVIRIGIISHS